MIFLNTALAASPRYRQTEEPPVLLDADVQAVIDLADTNGYTKPEQYKLDALSTFVTSLKETGEFQKMDILEVFSFNDTAVADFAKICIKRKEIISTVGGVTYTAYGFEGNGSTGYIDNKFSLLNDIVNYQRNNASRGLVVYKAPNIGVALDGQLVNFYQVMESKNSTLQRINSSSINPAIDLSGTGSKFLVRYDFQNLSGFNNGVKSDSVASSTATQSINITQDDYVLLRYGGNFSNAGLSMNFIGSSLTQAEVDNIRTYFNTYLMSIGLNQIA